MNRRLLAAAISVASALSVVASEWRTEGFEAFRRGTFGNAGHNLYVSRAGVLQRIFQYDLDRNGWFDLVFANCQDHHEASPSYLYDVAGGRRTAVLKGQGSQSGAVADLNGDGIDDIVVTGYFDMVTPFACAEIYYGDADGSYGERRHVRVQAPRAVDTAVGRFDGGMLPSLAFAMPEYKVLRICRQTKLGFEWKSFTDLPLEASVIASGDFDGDGFDDLACRADGSTASTVLWGSDKGLQLELRTEVPARPASEYVSSIESEGYQSEFEKEERPPRLMDSVIFNGKRCFSLSTGRKLILYSSGRDRTVRPELELEVGYAVACATGDFNGDGLTDIAIARELGAPGEDDVQKSLIWLNAPDGFLRQNAVEIGTHSASSVCAADGKVLFGQAGAGGRYTNDALLFSFENGRLNPEPQRFEGEDTRRAFLFKDAKGTESVFLVNRYARGALGFDRAYVYWGRDGRYAADDRTEVPCWCAVDSVCADLDDDGWAELMVCNNSENSLHLDKGHHIHHFGPEGFDPSRSTTLKTDVGWGAMVADFNRDGYLDVFSVCDMWSSLAMFEGGPDGFRRTYDCLLFPEKPEDAAKAERSVDSDSPRKWHLKRETFGSLRWPIAVDVNNDGWLDVACGVGPVGGGFVLWGGPQGFSVTNRQDLAAYLSTGVRAADLDGNGYPELIFGGHCSQPSGKDFYRQPHHSYLHIYWNGPEGVSDCRKSMLRADAASNLCVGDFDGNGWLDVYACSYQGDIDRDINSFIYWNRRGMFDPYDRQDLITHAGSGCLAVDFNEDGKLDLAVANHKIFGDHKGYSEVWWNTDEGFLPTRTTKLPTCGPHGMTAIEPGNTLTRGPEEYYVSEPYVAEKDMVVDSVVVEGEVPPKCWVKAMVRSDDGLWSEPASFKVKKGSRLQYRLALGATNALRTPRINAVRVRFSDVPALESGLAVTRSPARLTEAGSVSCSSNDLARYGAILPFQIGSGTVAYAVSRSAYLSPCNGLARWNYDFLDGFDFLTAGEVEQSVAVARSGSENGRFVVRGLPVVGFVPFGARLRGEGHPFAGSGFLLCRVRTHPVADDGTFDWRDAGVEYRLELRGMTFDGKSVCVSDAAVFTDAKPLRIGTGDWNFLSPGVSAAIPDDADLLLPCVAQRSAGGKAAVGVCRWVRNGIDWKPVSFDEIGDVLPRLAAASEPSLVRDGKGRLLFAAKTEGVKVWKLESNGGFWTGLAGTCGSQACGQATLGRTVGGKVFLVAGVAGDEQELGRLRIWPLAESGVSWEKGCDARNGFAEFGGEARWRISSPLTGVLRSSDGKLRSMLGYCIREPYFHPFKPGCVVSNAHWRTGAYLEDIKADGTAVPIWEFGTHAPVKTGRLTSVVDRIENADRYRSLGKWMPAAIDFLQRKDLATIPTGDYDIVPGKCWAYVSTVDLAKTKDEYLYEAHRRFFDIQAPISGLETMGMQPMPESLIDPFNEKGDYVVFRACGGERTLQPGEFALFPPPDGCHAPGFAVDGPRKGHKKVIIKILDEK